MAQRTFRSATMWLGALCMWSVWMLTGATCGTTQQVVVNGKKYKPDDAREAALIDQAQNAQTDNKPEKERSAWSRLVKDFPRSEAIPNAQQRLAVLSFQQKRWAESARYAEQALRNNNLVGPKRARVRMTYGKALLKLGRTGEALRAFEDAYEGLPGTEKEEVKRLSLRHAKKMGDQSALFYWKSRAYPTLPASEKQAVKQELITAIDGLPLSKLKVEYARSGSGELRFPFDYIAMRLALFLFHQHKVTASREVLERMFGGGVRRGHPLYQKAQGLLKRVRRRSMRVDTKAIGFLYPQSGRGASIGRYVRGAFDLATENLSGVRVIKKDSGSDPKKAIKALEDLVFRDKVIAVFGPVLSSVSKAVALRAQELGVPLFSINLQEGFADLGDYIFRNNLTFSMMGRMTARFAIKKLSLSRFAVLYPENTFGKAQVAAFWKEVVRLGGKIVGAESYPQSVSNFTEAAKRLVGRKHLAMRPSWYRYSRKVRGVKSSFRRRKLYNNLVKQFSPVVDFDAVFIPENYQYASMIAPTLAQQDIEVKLHYRYWEKQVIDRYKKLNKPLKFVQLLGSSGWNNEDIFLREPRHVVGSIFPVRYYPRSKRKVVQNFIKNYQRKNPGQFNFKNLKPPLHICAYTYDTLQMLIYVVDKFKPATREAFRDALFKIKDFQGVTGEITVQKNGEATAPLYFLVADRKKYFKLRRGWVMRP